MNYQKPLVAACVLVVLALSGCAGGSVSSSAATTPSSAPTKTVPANGEHFSSVMTLKDAFVTAGGDCSSFQETNKVTRAAESGDCGTGTVLSVYSSASDRDAVVDGQKQFADMIGMNLLVGENWIVNDKNVALYQPKLGGTLVTRTASK